MESYSCILQMESHRSLPCWVRCISSITPAWTQFNLIDLYTNLISYDSACGRYVKNLLISLFHSLKNTVSKVFAAKSSSINDRRVGDSGEWGYFNPHLHSYMCKLLYVRWQLALYYVMKNICYCFPFETEPNIRMLGFCSALAQVP